MWNSIWCSILAIKNEPSLFKRRILQQIHFFFFFVRLEFQETCGGKISEFILEFQYVLKTDLPKWLFSLALILLYFRILRCSFKIWNKFYIVVSKADSATLSTDNWLDQILHTKKREQHTNKQIYNWFQGLNAAEYLEESLFFPLTRGGKKHTHTQTPLDVFIFRWFEVIVFVFMLIPYFSMHMDNQIWRDCVWPCAREFIELEHRIARVYTFF